MESENYIGRFRYLLICFSTIEHIENIPISDKIKGLKNSVHIVKVSDDTFAQPEIIPIFGIMLCVLSLISSIQNYCELCGKKYINNNYHIAYLYRLMHFAL